MHDELVRWFAKHQRLLPWRAEYNPYHVWVSEVMLQQTQVSTVLPYFERFLAALPSISALAAADEQQILTLWAGLGYYSRVRNLQAAAKIVVEKYRGVIPDDYEALRSLPGIGQYMAGAILSIAFNKPYPIVDGNVRRGLPLFLPVEKNLRRAEKLLRNMSAVAAIQSAIALIRKHRGEPPWPGRWPEQHGRGKRHVPRGGAGHQCGIAGARPAARGRIAG